MSLAFTYSALERVMPFDESDTKERNKQKKKQETVNPVTLHDQVQWLDLDSEVNLVCYSVLHIS